MNGSEIKYSTPDSNTSFFNAQTTEASGTTAAFAFQVQGTREQGAKKVSLAIITAGREGCNDGMSDTVYKYSVLATVESQILVGCCKLTP